MNGESDRAALTDIHIADWTIVHVTGDLTAESSAALSEHVVPMLLPGARVAIDVRRGSVEPGIAVSALVALLESARGTNARVVVIEPDGEQRESLLADGVFDVHESLDAALHVIAPASTHARDPHGAAMAPASTDALLVSAEDMTGQDTGHHT